MRACVPAKLFQSCPTLVTHWTVAHQALLSMGFSRKNTGVGFHFLLFSVCDILQGHTAVK